MTLVLLFGAPTTHPFDPRSLVGPRCRGTDRQSSTTRTVYNDNLYHKNSRLEHTHEDMIMSACMTSRPHCATGMLTGSKPFVLMQLGGAHCEHLSTSVRSPQRRAAAAGQRAREAMVGYEAHSTGSSPQTDTRTDELWPAPVEAAALPPSASRRGTPRMLPLLSGRLERD